MTPEQMRELVKECGLDWQRGYMPLFEGDTINRFAVLIAAATSAERERCAKLCDDLHRENHFSPPGFCAMRIREQTP